MEQLLLWGLDFIRTVQVYATPQLNVFMITVSALGGSLIFTLLLPFFYWCIDEKKGLHLYVMVLISLWINITLKHLLDQPRPFYPEYDPFVGIYSARMGGLPSGHAQNTFVMFAIIASWFISQLNQKKAWIYGGVCALCVLLIGFSRIYLGVIFPTDILGGWIVGGILLCGYFLLRDKVERFLSKGSFRAGMIASAVLSFIFILNIPGEEALMASGFMMGIGGGYCLNRRYIGFNNSLEKRTGIKKILILFARMLLGVTGIALLAFATDQLFPKNTANHNLFGFAHFLLWGLWISVAAPWIFVKLRLVKRDENYNNA